MKQTVLFLCPHSAAKSVIAAAYAVRFARDANLELSIHFAGTEPDAVISQRVVDLLTADGLDVSAWTPQLVSTADLDRADYVISLGCDLHELRIDSSRSEFWDVPAPSQDLIACRDEIRTRVNALIATLSD
jgi:arsenate reductase (thioredoxin)